MKKTANIWEYKVDINAINAAENLEAVHMQLHSAHTFCFFPLLVTYALDEKY